MLEIHGLSASYGRTRALKGIDLVVGEGEVVGLLGPNGAGKSTTLATITGLLRPDAGAITFEGARLNGLSPERIVKMGISLVPEGRQIFSTLTVAENLRLGLTPRRKSGDEGGDLSAVLERFPILHTYYREPAARLSGGEQQQLALARALLARPRLLLLDEPSLGLAPQMIDRVFDILADLHTERVTILVVEQQAVRAIEFADRSYLLRNGEIAVSGTRADLIGTVDLAAEYLGSH